MRIPGKSSERQTHNNFVLYNRKENIVNDIPTVSTQPKSILKIILIVISVVAGTAVCSTVVYFVAIKKKVDDSASKNVDTEKYIKTLAKNRVSYKCSDIVENCYDCKEMMVNRRLVSKEVVETDPLASIACTSCEDNYYPIYNEDNIIIFCKSICVTGGFNLCKSCDEINQNQCKKCNYGYYLPSDDMVKTKCKSCNDLINNCEECYGTTSQIKCQSCNENYFLNKEKNICEPLCETGSYNYCKTCNIETNKCDSCISGYYLPTDDEEKKCKKCSDINDKCQECYGTKNSVKCLSCKNGLIPFYDKNNEILECNLPCSTGNGNLCKSCDYEKNKCIDCNEGYYLPSDDLYKLKCKKCTDIIENCDHCHGQLNSVICDDYANDYIAPFTCNWNCETGINEKCHTCDTDKNQCIACNEGYFLPTDDKIKLECKKCSNLIDHCIECSGKTYLVTCMKCMEGYILSYDQNKQISICILKNEITYLPETEEPQKKVCITGYGEKCLTCNYLKNICSSCNEGYYLPSDDNEKTKCKKCSLENCQSCEGTIASNYCLQCLPSFTPTYENSRIIQCKILCKVGCKTCTGENLCASCEVGYKLVNGECILNYTFRATYFSETPYEKIYLFHSFEGNIKALIVDGEEVQPTANYYNFPEPKIHEVYVLLIIPSQFVDYSNLFYNCQNLLSIQFTPLFNTSKVTDMNLMFAQCYNLNSIDLKVFDTKNLVYARRMFSYCKNLISIDITNFNTSKVVDISSMFSNCYSLTSIDLSNFRSPKLSHATAMFAHCHSLTSIDFSNVRSLALRDIDQLFDDCPKLVYLNINNLYTDQVTTMDYLFRNCSSLTSIDLSIFSTSSLKEMDSFFEGCTSLTSIDIWQFKTNKCNGFRNIFRGCKNLKYINMASSTYSYSSTIFDGVPDGGTIIVHPTRITNAEKFL